MSRKIVIVIFVLLTLFGRAQAKDLRALKIEKFLARYCPPSPLRGKGSVIVRWSDRYGLDYRLYVAIAGAESTWGKNSPKKSYNFTGISNGAARFRSIDHNIKFTCETIATRRWYRKYRRTRDIKDLAYVFKGIPPYDRYIRSLNYIFAMVDAVSPAGLQEAAPAKTLKNPLLAWNSIRYDKFETRKTISAD